MRRISRRFCHDCRDALKGDTGRHEAVRRNLESCWPRSPLSKNMCRRCRSAATRFMKSPNYFVVLSYVNSKLVESKLVEIAAAQPPPIMGRVWSDDRLHRRDRMALHQGKGGGPGPAEIEVFRRHRDARL